MAADKAYISTSYDHIFLLVDETDGHTAETGLSSFTIKLIKVGATSATTITPSVTELAEGFYKFTISASDVGATAGLMVVIVSATGCRTWRDVIEVEDGTRQVTVKTNNDKTGMRLSATGVKDIFQQTIEGVEFGDIVALLQDIARAKSVYNSNGTLSYRNLADTLTRIVWTNVNLTTGERPDNGTLNTSDDVYA